MELLQNGNDLAVTGLTCFNLDLTVDCGQSFRWKKEENGRWYGVVGGNIAQIEQDGDTLIFYNTDKDVFEKVWCHYFDFDRDYKSITDAFGDDEYLSVAVKEYYGIRVLNQEPWETLCSFIISQNNNIPRIKKIINSLCENFGERIGDYYTFPSAETVSKLTEEQLQVLHAGFRVRYILDAARKVSSGEIDLERIKKIPIEEGRKELMTICGVGPKVAECVLLYSCEKTEAFPVDVWVKRIISELYPEGLPDCMGEYRGIAQQYLFHWRRNL